MPSNLHSSELIYGDLRDDTYMDAYLRNNPSNPVLIEVADTLVKCGHGLANLSSSVGSLLRRAYDEVIDMPRTGRWSIEQLEKTEKTYIGTKVEILLRHELSLPKGTKLDLLINGRNVDVKHTLGENWTLPEEAFGEVCLLIKGDEINSAYSLGLVVVRTDLLNPGKNRDRKATLSAKGRESIFWITKNARIPENFFLHLNKQDRDAILSLGSGAARVRELFKRVRGTIIHRDIVCGLAQQKDPMKRVRGNGGARDALANDGIRLLSGKYDGDEIRAFGGPSLGPDDFISYGEDEIQEIRRHRNKS
jgi:hypothetical protein